MIRETKPKGGHFAAFFTMAIRKLPAATAVIVTVFVLGADIALAETFSASRTAPAATSSSSKVSPCRTHFSDDGAPRTASAAFRQKEQILPPKKIRRMSRVGRPAVTNNPTKLTTPSLPYTFPLDNNWAQAWSMLSWAELENPVKGMPFIERREDDGKSDSPFLRVIYPKDSASLFISKTSAMKQGGAIVWATGGISPRDTLILSYQLRVPEDFDYSDGGTLPGLVGGLQFPNFFCAGVFWDRLGTLGVYGNFSEFHTARGEFWSSAQLPADGKWHTIELKVSPNPGPKLKKNGIIKLSFDGNVVWGHEALILRSTDAMKLEGLAFQTFFGNGFDRLQRSRKDTYIDFRKFTLREN